MGQVIEGKFASRAADQKPDAPFLWDAREAAQLRKGLKPDTRVAMTGHQLDGLLEAVQKLELARLWAQAAEPRLKDCRTTLEQLMANLPPGADEVHTAFRGRVAVINQLIKEKGTF